MNTIVVVSGGFDPIHSGHIELLRKASELGDYLIVALNSDAWLSRKKGKAFMPFDERKSILMNIRVVREVISFDDSDNTAIDALEKVKVTYPSARIIFANGGDRTSSNITEMIVSDVEFVFGVGGTNKMNSSSSILAAWQSDRTIRPWGWWEVVKTYQQAKVKELVVMPGQQLSYQRHEHRSELWTVLTGIATVRFSDRIEVLHRGDQISINQREWHQLKNCSDEMLHVLEVQLGDICDETDIERCSDCPLA